MNAPKDDQCRFGHTTEYKLYCDRLDYFIARTEGDIEEIKQDLKMIISFKYQIIGGAVVISTVCAAVVTILGLYLSAKGGG
jgi:hypothetical protein